MDIMTTEKYIVETELSSEFQRSDDNTVPDLYMKRVWCILKTFGNILGGILITSYLLSAHICVLREDVGRVHLMSTLLIGTGLSSIVVQAINSKYMTVGSVRLGYLLCSLSILQQPEWKCPGDGDLFSMGPEARTEQWKIRLKELQGTILFISIAHIFIGIIGGRLHYLIKPVNLSPTLILIGLTVTKTVAMDMATNSSLTLFITTVMCIAILYYITNCWNENICKNSSDDYSCWDYRITTKLYPAVIGCTLVWIICAFLSGVGLITVNITARTDTFTGIFEYVDHVRIPSLFQWGMPSFKLKSIIIMIPALLASIYEAVADRYKQFEISSSKPVIPKLIGSNIMLEGICTFVSSIIGAGIGMNVNTKLPYHGGRSCINFKKIIDLSGSILMILIAFCGALCAYLSIIPEPIIAALIFVAFSSVTIEGVSILRYVQFNKRNIYIFGISLFLGIVVPLASEQTFSNENVKCLMTNGFFVTGISSLLIDAILPESVVLPVSILVNESSGSKNNCPPSEAKADSVNICDCFCSLFA